MLRMTDKPKVLRTVARLVEDLDLEGREYPTNPADLSPAQEEALHIEWLTTRKKTGEQSFSAFLKRRLSL